MCSVILDGGQVEQLKGLLAGGDLPGDALELEPWQPQGDGGEDVIARFLGPSGFEVRVLQGEGA